MAEDLAEQDKVTTEQAVLDRLSAESASGGFHCTLDADHSVTHISRSGTLMVSFATLENTLQVTRSGLPVGLDFVEEKNWSLLHFASRSDSWFRAQSVYAFIDGLVDDAFFEGFDRVIFFGAGIGAYAACAYSVAAPGATVLAIAPQATLDTSRAGWDMRFPEAKRLHFDTRYGYAPDMVEGAQNAFILYDPYRALDHVHASLFQGPNITRLRCRHLDGLIEYALHEMDLMHRTIEMAASGTLTEQGFYKLLRARRTHSRYLRTLVYALGKRNRPTHVATVCKHVLNNGMGGPFFRKNLASARETLSRYGKLPDWMAEEDTGS
ncbi:MAG: phosphoadenosine phosphosulfate reductase [Rhodobacter sp.]|nr:phosphoadenosine phosphosulfate reductase [Rhodobacter sp.]